MSASLREEYKIEHADAVMELFGFPEEFRQAELDEIHSRHVSARTNPQGSA